MEPMTLGSPVGSPRTGRSSPGSPQSPYTPAFLIRNEFTSPQLNNSYNHSFSQKEPTLSQTSLTSNKVLNYNLNEHQKQSPAITKTGGPPTTRLFDSLDSVNTVSAPPKVKALNQSTLLNNTSFGTPVGSGSYESSNWVTVFGFTNSYQCQSILAQLGQLGNIVEVRHPPKKEESNWVHIKLNSKMEAKRVLACNGKIYATTMIGVLPCKDTSILRDVSNMNHTLNNTSFGGDTMVSPRGASTSYWDNTLNSPPLVHDPPMLFMQENDNVVPQSLPSKDNGIVSKTLDYFFGW
ncbi:hypothetical protein M8J75_009600 [Diaphorina citri]|nr:hypothetical protein M8J75_009600 [Diaphorina citri]